MDYDQMMAQRERELRHTGNPWMASVIRLKREWARDCPACGSFSKRCYEDMDDGTTRCGVSGGVISQCEACGRDAYQTVELTMGGDSVHVCRDCAR